MRLPLGVITSLLVGGVLAAQAEPSPARAPRAPRAAVAVQADFVATAKAVWPGIVTVRAFARTSAAAPASRPDAASRPAAAGWVAGIDTDYPGFELVSAGTGFFVDASGDVLTCHHILQKPDRALADLIELELDDGSRVIAEVVGAEPTVNLAIVHPMVFPHGHARQVTALRFGDSESLETGMWTLAFGNPDGPEKFFAPAVFIARPTRDCYQEQISAFHMQTALVAHPQAYGGPLVNLDGEVVGILGPRSPVPGGETTAPKLGIELAMPSKIVTGLYESIRQARSFHSPWLGFAVMSRAEIATVRGLDAFNALVKPPTGILIENVFQPSPAAAAGIQPGDFMVGFDQTRIFTPVDFQKCLYLAGIGKEVTLELFRNGEKLHRKLAIERRPPEATPR